MKTILSVLMLGLLMAMNVQSAELGQKDSECIYTKSSLSRAASQNLVKGEQVEQEQNKTKTMSK